MQQFVQPKPHTRTYTEMVRAAGGKYFRAYTSTTRHYHRIKLWGYHTGPSMSELQQLFPEAVVEAVECDWSPVDSFVLKFPR